MLGHLTIEIKGTSYGVLVSESLPRVVTLEKRDGTAYDVTEGSERTVCTCPDFMKRHADLPYSDGCKHVRALAGVGLVRIVRPASHATQQTTE